MATTEKARTLSSPSIDAERLRDAARAAADIYTSPSSFPYLRTIEQFKLSGEPRGGYRRSGRSGRAIVAIKGTSPIGNWLFTNQQAHFTEFRVVDDQLKAVTPKALQGGQMRVPIEGALHQGYFRAFSLMWYGTEPLLGDLQRTRLLGLTRLVRYGIVFAFIPLILSLLLSSVIVGLALGLALAFAVTIAESGVWEDLFHREPAISGDSPMSALHQLNEFEEVLFTGHSLGGAIATIAYAVYRAWCRSDPARRDNALLITFGAPRVGDVEFMEAFCKENLGRYCHVVDNGDPVPQLPPNGLYEITGQQIWRRGLVGFGITAFCPLWATVSWLYKARRAARWTSPGQLGVGPPLSAFRFRNHSIDSYVAWADTDDVARVCDLWRPKA